MMEMQIRRRVRWLAQKNGKLHPLNNLKVMEAEWNVNCRVASLCDGAIAGKK